MKRKPPRHIKWRNLDELVGKTCARLSSRAAPEAHRSSCTSQAAAYAPFQSRPPRAFLKSAANASRKCLLNDLR
jgi:hypothetical protein